MKVLIEILMANMNFQLVVNVKNIVSYMTKYICKPEMEMSKDVSKIVQKLINVGLATNVSTRGV